MDNVPEAGFLLRLCSLFYGDILFPNIESKIISSCWEEEHHLDWSSHHEKHNSRTVEGGIFY